MSGPEFDTTSPVGHSAQPGWRTVSRIGGTAALLQLACVLVTIAVVFGLGGEPSTARECYELLEADRLVGLLRLDFATLFSMALYYLTIFGIYAVLRRSSEGPAALATTLAFVGLTLWLSVHSAVSMVHLADRFAAAATEAERAQLLVAGEAVLASNMWNSSAAVVAGLLAQTSLVALCVLMLSGPTFGRWTAWIGIAANGIDLLHIAINVAAPGNPADVLMMVAGPLYPVWFALVARDLLRAAGEGSATSPS